MEGDVLSVCTRFKWTRGVVYKERLRPIAITWDDATYADNLSQDCYSKINKIFSVEEGFHAYISRKRASIWLTVGNRKVMRFIIPKGSEVVYDATGCVVSNQMMLPVKVTKK